jgi:hypothetical protein
MGKALIARRALRMVRATHGPKIGPRAPQMSPIGDALDMVDLFGRLGAHTQQSGCFAMKRRRQRRQAAS